MKLLTATAASAVDAPKNIPLFTATVAGPSDPPGRGGPLSGSLRNSHHK